MEQKKILWILVAVGVFMLLIFGTAIILYWPSRSIGPALQSAATVTPNVSPQTKIDPDSWVRDPGTTPSLDNTAKPAPGNINLTIVNGDNAGANYGTVDVTGLTKDTEAAVIQNDTTLNIPGQPDPKTPASSTGQTPSVKTATQALKPIIASPKSTATLAAAPAAAKPAVVKSPPPKTVTVIEYWIQTGSFASKINAEKARDSLTARYLKAEIFTKTAAGATNYRVRVGPYKSKTEAEYWLGTVTELPEFTNSYVSEVKTKK